MWWTFHGGPPGYYPAGVVNSAAAVPAADPAAFGAFEEVRGLIYPPCAPGRARTHKHAFARSGGACGRRQRGPPPTPPRPARA